MAPRGKKKQCDPFLEKERCDTNAPSMLGVQSRSKNLVSQTQGTKIASEELKGLVTSVPDHGRQP